MELRMMAVTAGALLALVGSSAVISACGAFDRTGEIMEMEEGRNGVKAEVNNGNNGDYEVYLIPNTTCTEGDRIDECADADDYLVPPDDATPGVNPGSSGDDGNDD